MLVLREHGVTLAGVAGDPMVADYLLHAGERSHSMDDLANRYLDHQVIPITDLIGKGKSQLRVDQVATARVAQYSGEDADVAWRLCSLLDPKLEDQGLAKLYQELEIPLIEVLAELEFNGVRLDLPLLERLSREMGTQLADIEAQIHQLAGRTFNIASPRQLREVLFDELKLPTQRRTGITGEASTNQETLERLAALGHELPKKILEHRQVAKLKGTYVDALPEPGQSGDRPSARVFQPDGGVDRAAQLERPELAKYSRAHGPGPADPSGFCARAGLGTADGRLFADRAAALGALFARPGSQARLCRRSRRSRARGDADLRCARKRSDERDEAGGEDGKLRRALRDERQGLAVRLGISREDASGFIESYFARYPKVAEYQKRVLERCRRNRFASTVLGRRREISGIRPDSTYEQRNQPEREAINMEIQGSAADLIKVAMLNIYRRLRAERRRARMLLQIHDELVLEVPPDELTAVAELVAYEMATAIKFDVPLGVDLAAGPNWLEVSDLEPRGSLGDERKR